jgi:cysteine desulfurase / selenocysteine lyase
MTITAPITAATARPGAAGRLDVKRIRRHFDFPDAGRVVTNNAASTQPPRELLDLFRRLVPGYENVHRGQSTASRLTTERFEESYDTIAAWLNAPSRRTITTYRNTTEAHNAVMYSLLTQFRDGDNVVTTLLEHNSNFVPWYALCREILPRFGIRVECRVARFDHATGELDLAHLASLVDSRTKLVCCTGASNFFGSKPDLAAVRRIADGSGYHQPSGERRSHLLVDGAQLVPSAALDVQALDVDYLSFSFHKMLAPFGVGVLYAKEHLLRGSLPFLYGGDMIAEGRVSPDLVEYNDLPWKYSAGTPNILGVIVSAQALRIAVDLGPVLRQHGPGPVVGDGRDDGRRRAAHQRTDGPCDAGAARRPGADSLRSRVGHPRAAGRVQRGRDEPAAPGRVVERAGCGVPGRLPLRDLGAS